MMFKLILSSSLCLLSGLYCAFAQQGTLSYDIRDISGKNIPAKIIFLDPGSDKDGPDLGLSSSNDLATRGNIIYTKSGKGSVNVPVGQYHIWVGHGLEYSSFDGDFKITESDPVNMVVTLERVVDTRGMVSGDMHLHTYTFSGHGDANLEERLISCYAEGLEWLVATDHNHVVDYGRTSRKLKIHRDIKTTVGNEVSTPIGHFNTYPLASGSDPVQSDQQDANLLFSNIRKKDPGTVIQVNHPRWPGGDYFSLKDLDRFFGQTENAEFSWDFDVFELLNENQGLGWFEVKGSPVSVKYDWFNFLNDGKKITAVGNSDSHTVIDAIAGIPRNFIPSSTDEPGNISEEEIITNLRDGKVSISSGPLIRLGGMIGETLKGREISIPVTVQAADWVDTDRLHWYVNGVLMGEIDLSERSGTIRYDSVMNFYFERDSWVLFSVEGDTPMRPLVADYPVPIRPLAVTNPVWIDADSDGKIKPHNEYVAELVRQFMDVPEMLALRLLSDASFIAPGIRAMIEEKMAKPEVSLFIMYDQVDFRGKELILRTLSRLNSGLAKEWLHQRAIWTEDVIEAILVEKALFTANDPETRAHMNLLGIGMNELKAVEDWLRFQQSGENSIRWAVYEGTSEDPYMPDPFSSLVELDEHVADGSSRIKAETEFYSYEDGEVLFYLYANLPVRINMNAETIMNLPSVGDRNAVGTFISLPIKKGRNVLQIELTRDRSDRVFSIIPVNTKGLLDDELRTAQVHDHLAYDAPYEISTDPAARYRGTPGGMTDGWKGDTNYGRRFWKGFEGQDIEITIDLGEEKEFSEVSVGYLDDMNAWIFPPESVEVYLASPNGEFQLQASKEELLSLPETDPTSSREEWSIKLDHEREGVKARFVRVKIGAIKVCPDWHKGRGQKAWTFIDEIEIK